MRDYLKDSWWKNLFPQNPTQTRYDRFMEGPGSEIKTSYDKVFDRFNDTMKNWDKTSWDEYLEVLK